MDVIEPEKENLQNFSDLNHQDEIQSLKSKIFGLEQELSSVKNSSDGVGREFKLERTSTKESIRNRKMSVMIPSFGRSVSNNFSIHQVHSKGSEKEVRELRQELARCKR